MESNANLAAIFEVLPPAAPGFKNLLRLAVGVGLHDGEVRHIRPGLAELQASDVELVVQLAHAISAISHSKKNRRGGRNKTLHVAYGYVEWLRGCADFLQDLDRVFLTSHQRARRKDGDVGVGVGMRGMELPSQFFYEYPHRVAYVRNSGVLKGRACDSDYNPCRKTVKRANMRTRMGKASRKGQNLSLL